MYPHLLLIGLVFCFSLGNTFAQNMRLHSTSLPLSSQLDRQGSELGKLQLGLGFGIPYGGGVGAKLEYHPLSLFSMEAGIAHTILGGIGLSSGMKVYPIGPKEMKRAKGILHHYGSLHYGTNGILMREFSLNHPSNQTYSGFTVGMGTKVMWDRHGYNASLLLITTSGLFKDPTWVNASSSYPNLGALGWVSNRLKIAFGYEFSF